MSNDMKLVSDSHDAEELMENRFLSFLINDELYAIHIEDVTEIVGYQPITSIPNSKDYIQGIINLRGLIIPVVSIRYNFGLEQIEADEKTCIIIIKINDNDIGLIADEVSEVIRIDDYLHKPAPATNKGHSGRFLKSIANIDNKIFQILDLSKLLFIE